MRFYGGSGIAVAISTSVSTIAIATNTDAVIVHPSLRRASLFAGKLFSQNVTSFMDHI